MNNMWMEEHWALLLVLTASATVIIFVKVRPWTRWKMTSNDKNKHPLTKNIDSWFPHPPQPPLPVGPKVGNKQPCHVLPPLHFIWHFKFFDKSIKNAIGNNLVKLLITHHRRPETIMLNLSHLQMKILTTHSFINKNDWKFQNVKYITSF